MPNIKRVYSESIISDCEQSLINLKTDYIDTLFLHKDDETKKVSELIDTLEKLVLDGKILNYGLSNWSLNRISEAIDYCKLKGYKNLSSIQLMWSLALPNKNYFNENEHVMYHPKFDEIISKNNLNVFAYSSLAGGLFSKLQLNKALTSKTLYNGYFNYNNLAILNLIEKEENVNSFVLNYLISNSSNVFPLTSFSSKSQMLEILNYKFKGFDINQIKKLSSARNSSISFLEKIFLKIKYRRLFDILNLG